MFTSLNVVNIAVEFFASNKRFAIVLRRRVIGTRFSERSPEATAGASSAAAFAGAAGALPPFRYCSTSSLVMRPFLPEPFTFAGSTPFSASKRRTDGLNASLSSSLSSAAAAAGAAAPAPSTNLAMISSAVTVVPSSARISASEPSAGATTSSTTLSVSISTRFWSRDTASPGATCQVAIVASATDSGSTGTLMSTDAPVAAAGASAFAGAAASSAFAAGAALAAPPSSSLAITCSPSTVAPSSLIISPITPSAGATTSSTTLSVSMSTRFWSRFTASPAFTCHVAIVASATDSGRTGTLISIVIFVPYLIVRASSTSAFCCWL